MRAFAQRETLIAETTGPTGSAARWAVTAAQEALVPTAPAVEVEANARVGESEISPPIKINFAPARLELPDFIRPNGLACKSRSMAPEGRRRRSSLRIT